MLASSSPTGLVLSSSAHCDLGERQGCQIFTSLVVSIILMRVDITFYKTKPIFYRSPACQIGLIGCHYGNFKVELDMIEYNDLCFILLLQVAVIDPSRRQELEVVATLLSMRNHSPSECSMRLLTPPPSLPESPTQRESEPVLWQHHVAPPTPPPSEPGSMSPQQIDDSCDATGSEIGLTANQPKGQSRLAQVCWSLINQDH